MADMVLIKFYSLLIRTLSNPVSKSIKNLCMDSPKLSARCVVIGQTTHRWWSLLTIGAAGQKVNFGKMRIKSLDEAEALSRGSDVIAETFIFAVAGICISAEVTRNNWVKAKENEAKAAKAKAKEEEWAATIARFDQRLQEIEAQQKEMARRIEAFNERRANRSGWW